MDGVLHSAHLRRPAAHLPRMPIIALRGGFAAAKSKCWARQQHNAKMLRYPRTATTGDRIMVSTPASKLCSLSELAARIADGASVGIGGVFLHRGPFALVRELARQRKRNLEIIKPSPGYDLDLLCRAGAVGRVRAGIVAMEGSFGLARWYRKAVEQGQAQLEEHA
jgi:hypothetical protein